MAVIQLPLSGAEQDYLRRVQDNMFMRGIYFPLLFFCSSDLTFFARLLAMKTACPVENSHRLPHTISS